MRTLTSIALAASLALVLGVAGQASALSSVDLVFLGGATGDAPCTNGTDATPGPGPGAGTGDCVHTNSSDTIRFAIVVSIDSLGLSTYSFDLRWDLDGQDELDLVSVTRRNTIVFPTPNPTPPPDTLALADYTVFGQLDVADSTPGVSGRADAWAAYSASPTGPYIANTSFRVGTIAFHVNGNVNNDPGADIVLGFFQTDGPVFQESTFFNFITPNFGTFAVDSMPEPGTSLLMGMGVLGLILAGRASRKS
jgi:hypothetical protein